MSETLHTAYLLLGGNLGNRERNLASARAALAATGTVEALSPIFETEAWGLREQPAFLNQALALRTALGPEALLDAMLRIEQEEGRVRAERYGPRTLDIDLLFYDDAVIDTPRLVVPHPQLPARRFALVCLAAIAPGLRHPLLGSTIADLLAACADETPVYKFS
ncbi:MAG: 2-amino-4-hydroxy-6-hydroxymethyldihydropteridine diphosphokinase [Chitinophagaceae bacterium]|nr:MAG: 2-amino-4-hydroxy-6-hydroxymethyldihydropteridine diphosphokinase [Chitinophagaceae bacterium]